MTRSGLPCAFPRDRTQFHAPRVNGSQYFLRVGFLTKYQLKAMIGGTVNKEKVLQYLRRKSFFVNVFDVGLLALKKDSHLVRSPDGMALLDMSSLCHTGWSDGADIKFDGKQLWLFSVKIKAKATASTLGSAEQFSSAKTVFCHIDYEAFRRYIPSEHLAQVMQQATVVWTKLCYLYCDTRDRNPLLFLSHDNGLPSQSCSLGSLHGCGSRTDVEVQQRTGFTTTHPNRRH